MTPEIEELVERLLAYKPHQYIDGEWFGPKIVTEAAQAITDLSSKLEVAEKALEWQPIETMPPKGTWCVGRLEGEGRPPAFVGKVYDNPFAQKDPYYKASLIDEWTGNWKVVTGWMPLPPPPKEIPHE